MRRLLEWQAILMRRFEQRIVSAASAVAPVSDVDAEYFASQFKADNVATVPIGYEFGAIPPYPTSETINILFVGKLDWRPNHDGLLCFLRDIWPAAHSARPELKLMVVGSGTPPPGPFPAGVELLGRVDDLTPLYGNAALAVIPIHYGSGTRVKGIEAARYGRATLSTTVGVEGLRMKPDEHYYRADTAAEWIRVLTRFSLEDASSMGKRAYQRLAPEFSADKAASIFSSLVGDLPARE
jgi:glycosyltransferase involved in cell wall biosynthesis